MILRGTGRIGGPPSGKQKPESLLRSKGGTQNSSIKKGEKQKTALVHVRKPKSLQKDLDKGGEGGSGKKS